MVESESEEVVDAPEEQEAASEVPAARPPADPAPAAPAERGPDFIWAGQPVYRCRLCRDQYERVDNLAAVLDHEVTQHPTNARVSHVLGPGGQPLIVVD